MSYQIDQSGKIEQTQIDSIIAYANGGQYAVRIRAKLKRKIQEVFRLHGMTSLYIYFLFSVGIYYLVMHIKKNATITIDTEYPGKEIIILSILKQLLQEDNARVSEIHFARIGNRPKAHYAAKDVFDKKLKPDKVLSEKDIIEALKKTDGRLRECLATLVGVQPRSNNNNVAQKIKRVKQKNKKIRSGVL